MDPGEVAVGAGEVVELSLLSDPEDAEGHDAHQEDEQARGECDQDLAEVVFGVDGFGGGDAEVQDEQGHGDGEDTVAESGEAFDVLTGNTVVERVHLREFSIGGFVAGKSKSLPQRARGTRGKACFVFVIACSIVIGWGRGWAQGSESGDNSVQTPSQSSAQAPGKELPDAPGESKKKEQSGNPVEFVEHKTKRELLRARDWESGWIAGEYLGRNRTLVTPTREEREVIYLRETLTTPEAYIKRMFAAGFDQLRGTPRQWDDGWGGYGERFASREGQFIAANTLAALGNAKLGYEVRYDQCKCQGLWRRTRHAFLRNLVTYDRSEEHLHPQWALYGGAFGGGMISTAWKPSPKNAFGNGGEAAAEQVGWGTLLNFFTEFSREINRKQGVK